MTKRNSKRGKSRKGGFLGLFKDKHNEQNPQCNPSNLDNLTSTFDIKNKIDTCCPKSWYGRKNNSPYCKELDQKYDTVTTNYLNRMNASNANGVITDDNDSNNFRQSDLAYLTTSLQQNNTIGPSQINCKDYNLANLLTNKQKMEEYIKTCECDKSRLNPFSKKRKNCGIVNKKFKELQETENFQNRPTVNLNKSKINPYTYVNQGYSETDDETDDEYPVNMVTRAYPQYSSNEDDDEKISGIDYRSHQVLTGNKPAYGYGYGGKRSIGKRNIKKRKQKRRKTRKY